MTMAKNSWVNLLEPILAETFWNEYMDIPSQIGNLFDIVNSKKSKETYLTIAGGGKFTEFNGSVNYQDMSEGVKTEIENKEWASGFQIQRSLFDDDQYNIMKQASAELARNAKWTRETIGFNVYNHLFDATYSINGVNICSAAHPNEVGAGTQSNLGTTALSYTAFNATRALMRQFKGPNGQEMWVNPDTLIVPVGLEATALEAIQSEYKPAGGTQAWQGESNVIKNYAPKLIVSEYLTDANDWMLADSRLLKKFFKYQNRVPVSVKAFEGEDNLVMKYRGYFRVGVGVVDWRGIFGHQVA